MTGAMAKVTVKARRKAEEAGAGARHHPSRLLWMQMATA
jgi:hypothetical protein